MDFLSFPGGLTQSDWFGLGTGIIGTGYGVTAYNQAAYTSNVAMRQAQLYQEKNYHLGWVGIAREDIRSMMSITVNRIDNYNLVATLILATSADALLGVTFETDAPRFIKHSFWMSIALSIAYFALSIMFGIKGQNSAFTNTMKLLSWELRPENPSEYRFDYMNQAQQFERDGLSQLFRVPGVWPKYTGDIKDDKSIDSGQHSVATSDFSDVPMPSENNEGGAVLEHLEPETRRLVYLQRFAHFMQIWLPLEWYSKYCIGIGLISLAQGAAYFCMGRFYADTWLYRSLISVSMVAIFIFVTLTILRHNTRSRNFWLRMFVAGVFTWGPLAATIAILFPKDWLVMFAPLSCFGHCFLYVCLFCVSFFDGKTPDKTAEKYCKGPHGQRFDDPEQKQETRGGLREAGKQTGRETHPGAIGDPARSRGPGPMDMPTASDLEDEKLTAVRSLNDTLSTVRALVGLSAIVWFSLLVATAIEYGTNMAEGGEIPLEEHALLSGLSRTQISWPTAAVRPHAMACHGSHIFMANRYKVFRLVGSALTPEPCRVPSAISDITLTCDDHTMGGQQGCRPLILLSGVSPQVVDCAGHRYPLLQEPQLSERFAMHAEDSFNSLNGTVITLRDGVITEYAWESHERGWTPLWEKAQAQRATSLDFKEGMLFLFEKAKDERTGTVVDLLQVQNFQSLTSLGRWRAQGDPKDESAADQHHNIVAACAVDRRTVVMLTASGTLWRGYLS
jgi:hypothetical protein